MNEDDNVLKELILGTIFFGIVVALIGIWWVDEKRLFLLGLSIGIMLSVWRAVHIQRSLMVLLDCTEKQAQSKMVVSYATRTLAIFVVLGMMIYMDMGTMSILMCFVGLFGLKAGAWMQPYTHRVLQRG